MAIITISRQVAALGDEIADAEAKKLGYTFINRRQIEQRIVELGFPAEKLNKYDERKPGFFASLAKDRDEYLNYLQYAVLEAAVSGNCILIGRGSFIILDGVENLVSLRFVSDDNVRLERLKTEFNWNDRQAQARIAESDANRRGFHKSFFNLQNEDPQHFMLTLNTSRLSLEESVRIIETVVKGYITPEKEVAGTARVQDLFKGQSLVNHLLFAIFCGRPLTGRWSRCMAWRTRWGLPSGRLRRLPRYCLRAKSAVPSALCRISRPTSKGAPMRAAAEAPLPASWTAP